jgi:uncharacterized protein (DUF433 family)
MIATVLDRHIEITEGLADGEPRIAGHRIKVRDIATWHERLGKSADEICAEYDLSLADVYAALAYYFGHRESIDRDIENSEALIAAMRKQTPSLLEMKLNIRRDG